MFARGTEDQASLQDYSSSRQIRGVCDHWEKIRSSSLTAFIDSPFIQHQRSSIANLQIQAGRRWAAKPCCEQSGCNRDYYDLVCLKYAKSEWFKQPACSFLPPAVSPTPQSFWLSITAARRYEKKSISKTRPHS